MVTNMRRTRWVVYPFYWMIIAFLIPEFLTNRPDLHMILSFWKYIQMIIAVWLLVVYIFQKKMNCVAMNLLLIFYLWALISSIVNGSWGIRTRAVADIGISLFVFLAMNRSKERFLKVAAYVTVTYVLINLAIVLLIPEGLALGRVGQTVWFLGQKNSLIPHIIYASVLLTLYSYQKRGKNTIGVYLIIMLMCSTVFFVDSSNQLVIGTLMLVGIGVECILKNRRLADKLLSGRKYLILLVFFFVFVMRFSQDSNFMKQFTELIGRDITFTGRTRVWAIAFEYIAANPLLGKGSYVQFNTLVHAHDLYLDIAVRYGVPALVLLLAIIILTYKKSRTVKSPLSFYFLTLYLLGSIFEVYSTYTLFLICFTLISYSDSADLMHAQRTNYFHTINDNIS